MEGFALLIGHLAGDYLFQDDWQAGNKTNPHPGPAPVETPMTGSVAIDTGNMFADIKAHDEWCARWNTWQVGNIACAVHCSLYTFAVWLCSCWWMPWWGLLACWSPSCWPSPVLRSPAPAPVPVARAACLLSSPRSHRA